MLINRQAVLVLLVTVVARSIISHIVPMSGISDMKYHHPLWLVSCRRLTSTDKYGDVYKRQTLTHGLLEALLENNCAVVTCDSRGMPVGLMLPLCGRV